jgi:APA family basic amino acid/polyamine antiporter
LRAEERRWPRWVSALGLAGCIIIAFSLPAASVISGVVLFVAGAAGHLLLHRRPPREGLGAGGEPPSPR